MILKTAPFRAVLKLPQKHEQEHGDLLKLLVADADFERELDHDFPMRERPLGAPAAALTVAGFFGGYEEPGVSVGILCRLQVMMADHYRGLPYVALRRRRVPNMGLTEHCEGLCST